MSPHEEQASVYPQTGESDCEAKPELGITIMLAEQSLPFIRRVADCYCLLHRGRNVAQGQITQFSDPLINDWWMPETKR